MIRLLDGTRAYLHGVTENFSRKILAWRLTERFDPASTVAVLVEAGNCRTDSGGKPMLMADGGIENFNGGVDEMIETGLLRRVLAMTEIKFSNSMIESWWRA